MIFFATHSSASNHRLHGLPRHGRGWKASQGRGRTILERIDSRESQVKAWVHLDRDFALAQARECDRSANRGPIHGLPFAAKDIMDTADLPTEYGSPIYEGNRPAAAAAIADFMLPLAFGTQTVGAVIRPAAFCGSMGYKPSYGEVSTQGVKHNTASIDTVGLFARTVELAANR